MQYLYGSYVTIDSDTPVITVIDASNNTVFQGNTYQDPGTMITDANNTSYDGTVLATQLNTLILGAQNITYHQVLLMLQETYQTL